MNINQRIENLIQFSKLSPAEFAEKIDVQRSSISHILSGRNKPSLDFLIKIKDAFPSISWDWLINGQGQMEIESNEKNEEKEQRTPLPDLFTFVTDEVSSTFPQNIKSTAEKETSEQRNEVEKFNLQTEIKSASKKIQKIILLYEDGGFESFEPKENQFTNI